MKQINAAKLEFLSCSANEGFARSSAAAFCAQLDPTLDELGDIKAAVSEAVTNCIVHAYPDKIGKITMKMRLFDNNSIEILIKDKGVGIPDVDKARQPMFSTGGDDRSGMGFTIMESFMDKLSVKSKPNIGTTVTMRRKISSKSDAK